jgi:hypothetical protein
MSKQCRLFLLPTDTERLLEELRQRSRVRVISKKSSSMVPVEMASPYVNYVRATTGTESMCLDCFLVPDMSSEIRMHHLTKRDEWVVSETSDAVELAGCDYDGKTLRPGRLYFQTDQVLGDSTWPKRPEFLRWADQLMRITRGLLTRSHVLNAYVGADAVAWEQNGGRFEQM